MKNGFHALPVGASWSSSKNIYEVRLIRAESSKGNQIFLASSSIIQIKAVNGSYEEKEKNQ